VRVIVAVGHDTEVRGAGLELAIAALLDRAVAAAPAGTEVTAVVRPGRLELRDGGASGADDGFAVEAARAIARRAGGDVHVFPRVDGPGTLTVLELRAVERSHRAGG
jgi:hypothetical protein